MDKPELSKNEAQFLVEATEKVPTTGHQERNNMSITVNKLVSIVAWHEQQASAGPTPTPRVVKKAAAKKPISKKPSGKIPRKSALQAP